MSATLVALNLLALSATFAVMFGAALRLGVRSLRQAQRRPALFLRTLVAVWVGVPLLTVGVIRLLGVQGLSAATLILMAFCPGVPLLLASTRKVRGAVATSFVALVLTAVTEPLLIPYGMRIAGAVLNRPLVVQPWHILRVLVPTVFLPVALGFVIRARSVRWSAILIRLSNGVYAVGLFGSAAVVLLHAMPWVLRVPREAYAAAVLITVGDAAIGYWAGWPHRRDQKAIALAAALGNPALALAVVEASYPGFQAVTLVSLYLLIRAAALLPVELWLRRPHRLRPLPLGRKARKHALAGRLNHGAVHPGRRASSRS